MASLAISLNMEAQKKRRAEVELRRDKEKSAARDIQVCVWGGRGGGRRRWGQGSCVVSKWEYVSVTFVSNIYAWPHICECPFDVTNTVSAWIRYLSKSKQFFLVILKKTRNLMSKPNIAMISKWTMTERVHIVYTITIVSGCLYSVFSSEWRQASRHCVNVQKQTIPEPAWPQRTFSHLQLQLC